MRNPPWTADELILALDVYVNNPSARNDKHDPAIVELSRVLRSLGDPSVQPDPSRYRNANSVYLKLQNFKSIDPGYAGLGMRAGATQQARDAWDKYANDPYSLAMAANRLRQLARGGS